MTAFADTSFWFGPYTPGDARHHPAAALWHQGEPTVSTNLVVGEAWTLLRVKRTSHQRAIALVDAIRTSPRVELATVSPTEEERAWEWLRAHDERRYSFVDATSFALMRRRGLHEALAFDGDFTAAGFVELRP